MVLLDIKKNQKCKVISFCNVKCHDCLRQCRLMEMGFMPNAIVEVTQNNIFGICCKIGDSSYAISQEMASFITVELLDFVS